MENVENVKCVLTKSFWYYEALDVVTGVFEEFEGAEGPEKMLVLENGHTIPAGSVRRVEVG